MENRKGRNRASQFNSLVRVGPTGMVQNAKFLFLPTPVTYIFLQSSTLRTTMLAMTPNSTILSAIPMVMTDENITFPSLKVNCASINWKRLGRSIKAQRLEDVPWKTKKRMERTPSLHTWTRTILLDTQTKERRRGNGRGSPSTKPRIRKRRILPRTPRTQTLVPWNRRMRPTMRRVSKLN